LAALQRAADRSGTSRMSDPQPTAFPLAGRIGRQPFWGQMLGILLGLALLRGIGILLAILSIGRARETMTALDDLIGILTTLAFLVLVMAAIFVFTVIVLSFVSAVVRRLHDRGKSGRRLVLYCVLAGVLLAETLRHGAAMVVPFAAAAVLLWELIDLAIMPGVPAEQTSSKPA